jgi:uncharacterized repeat protein (TIGR01451 family)
MKKFTFLKRVFLTFVFLMCIVLSKAQMTVSIDYAINNDSNSYCSAPAYVNFYLLVETTGLSTTDSLDIIINFGDGTIESYKLLNNNGNLFYYWTYHTYYTSGHFNCLYVATVPTGESDTVIANNEVYISDSCGDISGRAYFDANGNCSYDPGETTFANQMIVLDNGVGSDLYSFTDSAGHYSCNVISGLTYTLDVNSLNNNGISVTCPPSGSYTISSFPQNNLDFGFTCNTGFDLSGSCYAANYVPGQICHVYLYGYNNRCDQTNGRMRLVFDPSLITFSNSIPLPDDISGDTLSWNFTNLDMFNSITQTAEFVMSTSAVIGDPLCITEIIEPLTGDADTSNNVIHYCHTITGSWDPNMKNVQPFDKESIYQNTPLTYDIHFQNTGNDTANKVIIIDTLDSNLDPSTIELMQSSHDMQFHITPDNVMSFTFNNIMLPDSGADMEGSNGFVKYRVNQKLNVPPGTSIINRAYIYFDFNPAVATNEVSNMVEVYVGTEEENNTADNIIIYPNPTGGFITISIPANCNAEKISIDDITGRIIKGIPITQTKNIDLSGLPGGIYYINIMTKDGIVSKKLIVSK